MQPRAIRVLSFGVLLDGVSTIPNALLMRAFQQRRRAAAQLARLRRRNPDRHPPGQPVTAPPGLAVGLLISNAVSTAMILWLAPVAPTAGLGPRDRRELFRLGLPPH